MTVRQLLANTDSAELTKWMAWYKAEDRAEAARDAIGKGTHPRLALERGAGGQY